MSKDERYYPFLAAYDRHPDGRYKKGDVVRVDDGPNGIRLFRVSADVVLTDFDVLPGEYIDAGEVNP